MPNAKEIKIEKLKVLVWGKPKSGKTYFFRTFPRPAKAYVFDPNGELSLRGEDIDYEVYRGPAGFRQFIDDLDKDVKSGNYKSIMIDSLTTLQDCMMKDVQSENSKATEGYQLQEYKIYFGRLRKLLIDLTSYPVHLLFTAHEQMLENHVTGEVLITPSVYGKDLPEEFPVYFDEVYHTEVKPSKMEGTKYFLRTQPTSLLICGGRIARSGTLKPLEEPDFNVILDKVLNKKKGKEEGDSKKSK